MPYRPPFSGFGGGPNGPNIGRQLVVIFSVWAAAKLSIKKSKGGGGNAKIAYKNTKTAQ